MLIYNSIITNYKREEMKEKSMTRVKGRAHLLRACDMLVPIPYNWNQNIKRRVEFLDYTGWR